MDIPHTHFRFLVDETMLARSEGDTDVTIATAAAAPATRRASKIPDLSAARTFDDILANIIADAGGEEGMGEGRRQLCRRAAQLSVACEEIEARAARGDDVDPVRYSTVANALRRVLRDLGGKRGERVA
jgi:hypothetical protein